MTEPPSYSGTPSEAQERLYKEVMSLLAAEKSAAALTKLEALCQTGEVLSPDLDALYGYTLCRNNDFVRGLAHLRGLITTPLHSRRGLTYVFLARGLRTAGLHQEGLELMTQPILAGFLKNNKNAHLIYARLLHETGQNEVACIHLVKNMRRGGPLANIGKAHELLQKIREVLTSPANATIANPSTLQTSAPGLAAAVSNPLVAQRPAAVIDALKSKVRAGLLPRRKL